MHGRPTSLPSFFTSMLGLTESTTISVYSISLDLIQIPWPDLYSQYLWMLPSIHFLSNGTLKSVGSVRELLGLASAIRISGICGMHQV